MRFSLMKKHALVRPNSKLRYFKHGAQIAIHIKYCNLDFGCFYASYVQTQEQQACSSPALSAKHLHRDMRRSCVNQLQLSLNKGLRFDSRSRIGAGRLRSNFEPEFKLWSARIQTGMLATYRQLTSRRRWGMVWIGMLPFLE